MSVPNNPQTESIIKSLLIDIITFYYAHWDHLFQLIKKALGNSLGL